MKIVQINSVCGAGSTGKICVAVGELLNCEGIENHIIYSSGSTSYKNGIKVSNEKYVKLMALKSRIFGNYGFNNKAATKRIIAELERIKPDIVHLHNIHSHDVHLAILFKYFKQNKTKLFWTFHDCWAFTAYCPYFDMVACEKWQTGCNNCPQKNKYSWFLDKSQELYNLKKELFSGLDLTIITPSKWLADLVKKSFLENYPVKVINNGIDLSVFSPQKSDFRKKYNCEDKFIILGVAFDWDKRKGLDAFIELSKRLDDKYKIVLVGTNEEIDKNLPKDIISIHRTGNQKELAEIYSACDVFVNPTMEENFPTVNIEAIACGTPVVTFNTGGSAEMLDSKCGMVVQKNDIDALEKAIIDIKNNPLSEEACVTRASNFDKNDKFKEYIDIYLKGE